MKRFTGKLALFGASLSFINITGAQEAPNNRETMQLDESCIISVLNRTVQADENGNYVLPNVPSFMGEVRARANCNRDGKTITGQTDFFSVTNNGLIEIGKYFVGDDSVATELTVNNNATVQMFGLNLARQLNVMASFADGTAEFLVFDVPGHGVNFSTSNPAIASVDDRGVITSHATGETLVMARKDGVLGVAAVAVIASGDKDGDGLPDYYEDLYGLNPNDPIDAFEDLDSDGLSNLDEFLAGIEPNNADTDGDDISDGEELQLGNDGFITNPLLVDSDGDGLSDSLEINFSFDPTDALDGDLQQVLESISVTPNPITIAYNTINAESTQSITVTGTLIDGSTIDLTSTARGTNYATDNLSVVSFGTESGVLFAAEEGSAQVTVTNGTHSAVVPVTVTSFTPEAVSAIAIPGYANEVAIYGDYALVAAGNAGLQVVDVTNKEAPFIAAALELPGVAIDIEVVDHYAFMALGEAGLAIIDLDDPESPALVTLYDTPGTARDLSINGNIVFVADEAGGVRILNVFNKVNIFEVGSIERLSATAVAVNNETLFVATGSEVLVYDITQLASPIRLSVINSHQVKALAFDNGVLHVAAYSSGWASYSLENNGYLTRLASGREFFPRGVAVTDGIVFWAEQLFPNVVAYTNTQREQPFFQNTINLTPVAGDYAGTGIAVDSQFVYITEERFAVWDDWKVEGETKLVIAKYREFTDELGVAPSVNLSVINDENSPSLYWLNGVATDDVGVKSVRFYYDNLLVAEDFTYPYQYVFSTASLGRAEECSSVPRLAIFSAVAEDFAGNQSTSLNHSEDFADDQSTNLDHYYEISADCDGDGLSGVFEGSIGTNPLLKDTDGDRLDDNVEQALNTNPLSTDSDGDGIEDGDEVRLGTDPLNPDTAPPELLETVPASNAIDVREDTRIDLFFDGELRRETVNTDTVKLLNPDGYVIETEILLSDDGAKISIKPSRFLTAETVYRVLVLGLRDDAGNFGSEILYSFQTGFNLELDDVAPRVTPSITPAPDGIYPTTTIFAFYFNEPVDPLTVNASTFLVQEHLTGEYINGRVELSRDRQSVQFVPERPLSAGHGYSQYLTDGIKDLWGNSISPYADGFDIGYHADAEPPVVESTTLTEGFTDVPLNVRLNVKFNERIALHTFSEIKLFSDGELVESNYSIDALGRWNAIGNLVTLKPVLPLKPLTQYVWRIGAVADLSGNVLEQSKEITFTTGTESDTARGSMEWVSFDGDHGDDYLFPLNTKFMFRYSERIDPTTIVTRVNSNGIDGDDFTDNSILWMRDNEPYSVTLGEDRQTMTLLLNEGLVAGRRYTFGHGADVPPKDLAGNSVGLQFYSGFKLGDFVDSEAPEIISSSFGDGAQSIFNGNEIRLNFSEIISEQCVQSDVLALVQNGEQLPVTVEFTETGRSLRILPESSLVQGDYTLTLAGPCDVAGNQSSPVSYDFSVDVSGDDVNPQLIEAPVEPIKFGTNEVVWIFDEPLDPASTIELKNPGSDVNSNLVEHAKGQVFVEGNTLRFIPDEPLLQGTYYEVDKWRSWIADLSGNTFAGTLAFSVESINDTVNPAIDAIAPQNGTVDLMPNQPVTVTFTEPVNVPDGSVFFYANGRKMSANLSFSYDRTKLSIYGTPNESLVSLIIAGVTDLSGNPLPYYMATYTFSQNIDNSYRPYIERSYPSYGDRFSTDISEITVLLDPDAIVDESTIDDGFGVYVDDKAISGRTEVVGGGTVLHFTADQPFPRNSRIDFGTTYKLLDTQGFSFRHSYGYFYTVGKDGSQDQNLFVNGFYPGYNQDNAPLNTSLDILFSREVDFSSLQGNVLLLDADENLLASTVLLDNNETLVSLKPANQLLPNHNYTIKVLGAVQDIYGGVLGREFTRTFATGDGWIDDKPPQVIATTPRNNDTNIDTNSLITVKYDEPINDLRVHAGGSNYSVEFSDNYTTLRYRPLPLLTANSLNLVDLPLVEDGAGNEISPSTLSVTAGAGFYFYDTYFVRDRDGGFLTSQGFSEVVFSGPIDPLTVSLNNITLTSTENDQLHDLVVGLNEGGETLYIKPASQLPIGSYTLKYSGFRGYNGSRVSSSKTRTLSVTSSSPDLVGPVLVESSVPSGKNNIPTGAKLRFSFNELISAGSLENITLKDEAGNDAEILITRTEAATGTLVTITPRMVLKPSTRYLIDLAGITDLTGNKLIISGGFSFETSSDYFGGSYNYPRWTSVYESYFDADEGVVPTNALVRIKYDHLVDATRLPASFAKIFDVTNSPSLVTVPTTVTLEEDLQTITIVGESPWQPNHRYKIIYGSGTMENNLYRSGSAYGLAGEYYRNYKRLLFSVSDEPTPDTDAPSVLQAIPRPTPAINSLEVTFDEKVSNLCIDDVESRLISSDIITSLTVGPLDYPAEKVLVELPSELVAGEYLFELSGMCDFAGNIMPPFSFDFTVTQ